eukprot:jgi/Botrbrau1/16036/Bobra.7_2s0010.1
MCSFDGQVKEYKDSSRTEALQRALHYPGNIAWSRTGHLASKLSHWIIEFSELTKLRLIGEGSMAYVYLGQWKETDVAVKTTRGLAGLSLGSQQAFPGAGQIDVFTNPKSGHEEAEAVFSSASQDASETAPLRKFSPSEGRLSMPRSPPPSGQAALAQDDELYRLACEAEVASSIRHPNVLLFMGICLDPPCLLMEWCARGTLSDLLRKARTHPPLQAQLSWRRRIGFALDAAKGLLHLHCHNPVLLHRDLRVGRISWKSKHIRQIVCFLVPCALINSILRK